MGKKKIEHVVFDGMRKTKKSIPFNKVNKMTGGKIPDSNKQEGKYNYGD